MTPSLQAARGLLTLVVLALGGPVVFAEAPALVHGDDASVSLARWIAAPTNVRPGTLRAGGAEILALDARGLRTLERWLRRGGELRIGGDLVESALQRIDPGVDASNTPHPIGLGWVSRAGDPPPPVSLGRVTEGLLEAGGRVARAQLPVAIDRRFATAARLAAYGLLLLVGCWLGRSAPGRWRVVGAGALVAVFATWSVASERTPWGEDRWSRVDVAVDVGEGPVLLWTAVALTAKTRHEITLPRSDSIWQSRVLDASGHDDPEATQWQLYPGSELRMGWLADAASPGQLSVSVVSRAGRLTGLVSNDGTRGWSDAWLLLPDAGPQPLESIAGTETRLIDQPLRSVDEPWVDAMAGLAADPRRKLVQEAVEQLARPLLARDRPVLVAWSDRLYGPPQRMRGRRVAGSTLLLRVAETKR